MLDQAETQISAFACILRPFQFMMSLTEQQQYNLCSRRITKKCGARYVSGFCLDRVND
jgi:hypothetical protein